MLPYQTKICKYFIQGKCSFGSKCRFNHDILNISIMRHAQSEFNKIVNQFDADFNSQEAKDKYQLNPNLVDCKLSNRGYEQIMQLELPSYLKGGKLDVIFVSPLQRTLQTVQYLLQQEKVYCKKVIVLPNLTQVFSKICDISSPIKNKITQYNKYDFSYLLNEYSEQELTNWQDRLTDQEYIQMICKNQEGFQRYAQILEQIFPTPMQTSQRCFNRTLQCLNQIKKISKTHKFEKILVVAHNRILKYMIGRDFGGKGPSMDNCQIRNIVI